MIGEWDTREIRIHPRVKVFPAGQEVGDGVCSTRNMFQGIVKILQEFDPAGLAARYFLGFPEILQVFMVGEDAHGMLHAEEQGTTTFEAKDYASQFSVVDVIVPFRREETTRVEGDGVHSIIVLLGDNYTQGITRSVRMHDKGFGPIGCLEHWLARTDFL